MSISKRKIEFLNNAIKWNDLVSYYAQKNMIESLVSDDSFFKSVMKLGCLNQYNVTFLLKSFETREALKALNKNVDLLYYFFRSSLVGFERIVSFYKSAGGLDLFLSNQQLFDKLAQFSKEHSPYLDSDKLGFLLGRIDSRDEVERLVYNETLLVSFVEDGKFNKLVSLFKNYEYLDILIESSEFFEKSKRLLTTKNYEYLLKSVESKNSFEIKSLLNLNNSLLQKCLIEGADIGLKLFNRLTDEAQRQLQGIELTQDERETLKDTLNLFQVYKFLSGRGFNSSQRRAVLTNDQNYKLCSELMTKHAILTKDELLKKLGMTEDVLSEQQNAVEKSETAEA